jgi:hypothetical protein
MRLYRLTLASIFQRKAWAICAFAVLVLPFALPAISSATEKPILVQPARIQAAWSALWVCAMVWGLLTAAKEGESNSKSGLGEYFLTTGLSATRQLFEIWLAVFTFIAPLALITGFICLIGAAPGDPLERSMWIVLNTQYVLLFLLVIGPLLALSAALSSRFGGIAGFASTLGLTIYGLYGVGYLEQMLKLEANPILQSIWTLSPHYRFADLTQRLYFKTGALEATSFQGLIIYFLGILAIQAAFSRICFRTRIAA